MPRLKSDCCGESPFIRASYYAADGSWPSKMFCAAHADDADKFTDGASGVSKTLLVAITTKDLEALCP